MFDMKLIDVAIFRIIIMMTTDNWLQQIWINDLFIKIFWIALYYQFIRFMLHNRFLIKLNQLQHHGTKKQEIYLYLFPAFLVTVKFKIFFFFTQSEYKLYEPMINKPKQH